LADAKGKDLDLFNLKDDPQRVQRAMAKVMEYSCQKKQQAKAHHQDLEKSVQVKG
jgi:hypothetical protein